MRTNYMVREVSGYLFKVTLIWAVISTFGLLANPKLVHAELNDNLGSIDSAKSDVNSFPPTCQDDCNFAQDCDEYLTGVITASEFNQFYQLVTDITNDGEITICLSGATIARGPTDPSGVDINTYYQINLRGVGSSPSIIEDNTQYAALLKFTNSGGSVENILFRSVANYVTAIELRNSFITGIRNVSIEFNGRGRAMRLFGKSTLQSLEGLQAKIVTNDAISAISVWENSRIDSISDVSFDLSSPQVTTFSLFNESSIGNIRNVTSRNQSGVDISLVQHSSIDGIYNSRFGIVQIEESKVGVIEHSQLKRLTLSDQAYLTKMTDSTLERINLSEQSVLGVVNNSLIRGINPISVSNDARLAIMRRSTIECTNSSGRAIFLGSNQEGQTLIDMLYAVQIIPCGATEPIFNPQSIEELRDVVIH